MKKRLLLFFLGMASACAWGQRTTDVLDRGLVAVKTASGVYCSWRITADEYYDVQYNIYRDGTKLNSEPLSVSNYTDKGGTASSTYTVEPVVRGTAQAKSAAVTPWAANYKEIRMDHGSLTSTYVPNDACVADVDGDGELEILLKFDNSSDAAAGYMPSGYNGEYAIVEVYKLDGTKLWWLDFGPNMADFQNNENNIVAYDWDGDGKAEAVMRAADGTTIHMADGTTYVVGDKSKNYRAAGGSSGQWFVHDGAEYLLYLNGETGKPYQCMEYPLKRLETGETDLEKAWGDGYGHRSTKHFFGAPYLDGRKPSIFLARGIYTRHKMIAYDVDPATHQLTERWRWNCSTAGSPWYGQGYHNYCVADVDWDGRDEIVFGSMVIDDNGNGLSTTGLGHGDSQHCSDFDPYTHGQEIFACLEENPNNNYRDATTSKIYYRTISGSDDGRAIMGNFIDDIPGAQGISAHDDNVVNSVTHLGMADLKNTVSIAQNFRIYWDGDLCSESFNYVNGKNTAGTIYKARTGVVATLEGSLTNNDTKGTPCYQGDILGDWREEVIMRTANNNIRIYTTNIETPWRNYTLWHDHQYRQAMVWQMCGYNQTPHTSYFLGELEGITRAPAPLTMTGRTEIGNGTAIGSAHSDKHIIMCETNDMTVSVTEGASPYILTVNAPTWVQGHDDNDNITTTTYTHTLTGSAFTGAMRLVKQGDGILNLPNVTQTYTGPTEVWAGVLNFDGTMQGSRVWLNRFAELNTDGGTFAKGIEMEYASVLRPGGGNVKGQVTAGSLILNYGAILELDLYSEGLAADYLKINTLKIDKKDWQNGPDFLAPVFKIVAHPAAGADKLEAGRYLIADVAAVDGNVSDIIVEGLSGVKAVLTLEDGKLYVDVQGMRDATSVVWTGANGSLWDLAETENFRTLGGTPEIFVSGDEVMFDDDAETGNVELAAAMAPASVVFNNNTLEYNITGKAITGTATLVKNGAAKTTLSNSNSFTGGTTINAGTLAVSSLANADGVEYGALGSVSDAITINNGAVLSVSGSVKTTQTVTLGEGGATFEVPSGSSLTFATAVKSESNAPIYKKGTGTLNLIQGNTFGKVYLEEGTIAAPTGTTASSRLCRDTLVFNGTNVTLDHENSTGMGSGIYDYTNYNVPAGKSGILWMDGRCDYYGRLSGEGSFTVYPRYVRNYLHGDWSDFTGVLRIGSNGGYSVQLASGAQFPNATVVVEDGATLSNEGVNVTLGTFTGTGTFSGSGTYTIGKDDSDILFSGKFSGSKVNKEGTGTWTIGISQPQTAIGGITLNGGTLYVATYNSSTSVISGTVTANSGTMVKGLGTINSLILNSGAELTPGQSTSSDPTGFFAVASTFNAKAGSVVNLNVKSASNSNYSRTFLKSSQYMILDATVNVTLSDAYTPKAGDEIILWEAATFTGNPTVNLPALPAGLAWDTSDLNTATGTLRIVGGTDGISSVKSDDDVRCRIYTLDGLFVTEYVSDSDNVKAGVRGLGLSAGVYILRLDGGSASKTLKITVK